MRPTVPAAAALGLAILGVVVTTAVPSPEASVQGSASARPGAAALMTSQAVPRMEHAQVAPDRPQHAEAPRAEPAFAPPFGPRARPTRSPARPQARSFLAKGPLVARVSDPAFGPRVRPDDLPIPDPPRTLAGGSDLLCIAVAIYHEARNQPLDGQLAVASVILNRASVPERWGASPCEVVAPGQFSFLSRDGSYPPVDEDEAWAVAVEMAREALERGPSPAVGKADHYHTLAVQPAWNAGMMHVIRIDDHVFFADPTTQG